MSHGHKACTKALAASPPSLQTAALQITRDGFRATLSTVHV